MRVRAFLPCLFLALAAQTVSAQTITITTVPATARITTRNAATGVTTTLGVGTARLKIEKESTNEIWIEAEGYQTIKDNYTKGLKYPKEVVYTMNTRIVKLNVLPYDAKIYLNGSVVGSQNVEIPIKDGTSATVEVKKPGYSRILRTYTNRSGSDVPPISENIELTDRLIAVLSQPSDASIQVDGQPEQKGSADVIVPKGKCVTARAVMTGFKPAEQTFCNKDEKQDTKMSDVLILKDRVTLLRATPAAARINVSGNTVGTGEFSLTVPDDNCVDVVISADAYLTQLKQYCNKVNVKPPVDDNIKLLEDQAFNAAAASDQANTNVTIEVNPAKTPDDAWRLISQIVMDKFDVLEITDKETGYMRTAWQANGFEGSMVRTRVIIKLGSSKPLKYVVKLASEHSDAYKVTVKDDEKFKEWPRVMLKYKDLINEMQSRLR